MTSESRSKSQSLPLRPHGCSTPLYVQPHVVQVWLNVAKASVAALAPIEKEAPLCGSEESG